MYEKMANTLNVSGKWNIHIIGYGPSVQHATIHTHGLGKFNRFSLARLRAPLKVLIELCRIKPHTIIINTHELLLTILIYKIVFRCKIIYDVRENYFLNILHTQAFPASIRYCVAGWVRLKEWGTQPFINHYLLSEEVYAQELNFVKKKFTILENKSIVPDGFTRKPNPNKVRLLFTGTIDTTTGIWEAIHLGKVLHQVNNTVELIIVGYSISPVLRDKVLEEIKKHNFISYRGIDHLVSHSIIMEEISRATAGVVYYPPSPHNRLRVPTKLYEYLACGLPILYDPESHWHSIVSVHSAGIGVDFKNPDPVQILNHLAQNSFYPHPVGSAHWQSEEGKFLTALL